MLGDSNFMSLTNIYIILSPVSLSSILGFTRTKNLKILLPLDKFVGSVPIIRSPKGNAAEMVAQKLDKKLRENLFDARNNLFLTETQSGNFNFQRPLLIILDRNVDMATPLHHTWTYQALAHDLLDLTLNRVVIEETTSSGGM